MGRWRGIRMRGIVIEPLPGASIDEAIEDALEQANWPGAPDIFLSFNGAVVFVQRSSDPKVLRDRWSRLMQVE